MYDVIDEVDCSICRDLDNWLVLDPLGELVDYYQHVIESPGAIVGGPIISRLQHVNGQDGGTVIRLWAGT